MAPASRSVVILSALNGISRPVELKEVKIISGGIGYKIIISEVREPSAPGDRHTVFLREGIMPVRVQINHNSCLIIVAITLLITIDAQQPAMATDFNDALRNSLGQACGTPPSLGSNLRAACDRGRDVFDDEGRPGPVGGVFSSIGASPESAGLLSTQQRWNQLKLKKRS
jgi:hypothetical protein